MQSPFRSWVVVACFVMGCSGSSVTGLGGGGSAAGTDAGSNTTTSGGSSSVDTGTEQVNGACPSRPKRLQGAAAVGDDCTKASDCEPTCCSCDEDGAGDWLAAACVDGKCASATKACSRTKKPALCGSSSTSSGGSSGSPPPSAEPQCGTIGFVGTSAQACEACWSAECCAQKKWCADTPECGAYLSCRATCPGSASGPACMQCRDLYPVGATIIDGMVACLGSSCDAACAQASMP